MVVKFKVEKPGVENSRVEKFMVEMSGIGQFMVEKIGVEVSCNLNLLILVTLKDRRSLPQFDLYRGRHKSHNKVAQCVEIISEGVLKSFQAQILSLLSYSLR